MTTLPGPSDDDLLRQIQAGDEQAFTLLYRRWQGGIYRFALRMSGSASLAEEVTQEVFMVLVRGANQYDPARGSVCGFLYGVGRNHVLRSMERDRRFVPLASGDAESAPVPEGRSASDPLGDLARAETIERVRQAVVTLPPRYREVGEVSASLHDMNWVGLVASVLCSVTPGGQTDDERRGTCSPSHHGASSSAVRALAE